MAVASVKEGWLEKLKRGIRYKWKRFWFRLNTAGELTYFESPDRPDPVEHKIIVYAAVTRITVGENCEFSPPEGRSKFCLLQLKMRDGKTCRLCADTPDERKEWAMMLTNALQSRPGSQANPGHQGNPGHQSNLGGHVEQTRITLPTHGRYGSCGSYEGKVLARPEQASESGFQGNMFLPDFGGYEGRVLSTPGQASAPPVVRTETNADGSQTTYVRDPNPQYVVMDDGPHERYRRRWNQKHMRHF